jgi:hypothetical protein
VAWRGLWIFEEDGDFLASRNRASGRTTDLWLCDRFQARAGNKDGGVARFVAA